MTPLHVAACIGHVDCVREILRAGASVDKATNVSLNAPPWPLLARICPHCAAAALSLAPKPMSFSRVFPRVASLMGTCLLGRATRHPPANLLVSSQPLAHRFLAISRLYDAVSGIDL